MVIFPKQRELNLFSRFVVDMLVLACVAKFLDIFIFYFPEGSSLLLLILYCIQETLVGHSRYCSLYYMQSRWYSWIFFF